MLVVRQNCELDGKHPPSLHHILESKMAKSENSVFDVSYRQLLVTKREAGYGARSYDGVTGATAHISLQTS